MRTSITSTIHSKLKMSLLTALAGATATLVACSPPSPKLTSPPEAYVDPQLEAGDFQVDFNPKVDILFVIDNSASMKEHQERLSQNVDRFVDAFSKNSLIDYHIGIVTVSDRTRQYVGSPHFFPAGQLRPLKSPGAPIASIRHSSCVTTDSIVATANPQPGYITRETPQALETLRESLKVGVQCLDDGGPEFEELFTPVAQALSSEMRDGPNKGFYRQDAHLVVILVSDAAPSSLESSPKELVLELRRLKNFNSSLISTHAIGIHPEYACVTDPSLKGPDGKQLAPERLQQFVAETNGRLLSLCPHKKVKDANGAVKLVVDPIPWGDRLAEMGLDIRRRTLGREIRLQSIPEVGTIDVRYGSQEIKPESPTVRGWTYNDKTNALILSGDIELQPEPGAQLNVKFTQVNLYNLRTGRARRME